MDFVLSICVDYIQKYMVSYVYTLKTTCDMCLNGMRVHVKASQVATVPHLSVLFLWTVTHSCVFIGGCADALTNQNDLYVNN